MDLAKNLNSKKFYLTAYLAVIGFPVPLGLGWISPEQYMTGVLSIFGGYVVGNLLDPSKRSS